jgi:thioredoxin 1
MTDGDGLMPAPAEDHLDFAFSAAEGETGESLDRGSVKLASHSTAQHSISQHSISQHSIRTLQAGEDLSELVDDTQGVVLLDFYADWCGPCRKQSKVLHEVEEFASDCNAQIIKVNVDDHRDLAKKYQVSSLPTLLAVKDGTVRRKKTGLTDRHEIEAMLR